MVTDNRQLANHSVNQALVQPALRVFTKTALNAPLNAPQLISQISLIKQSTVPQTKTQKMKRALNTQSTQTQKKLILDKSS